MSTDATGANARPASLDAGPLGYLALGLTLLGYGLLQTGVLHHTQVADAAGLAHLLGGVALFIAGLWQLRAGDTLNGTAFAGLGAFWAVWSMGAGTAAGGRNAVGLFLLLWAMLALTLTAASWQGGLFNRAVFGLLTLSLLLNAVGVLNSSGGLVKAAGWVAAVAGLISWYWATAALTNHHWGRAALPVK